MTFLIIYFSDKIRLVISCEFSARQMIHINVILFSLKNNKINFRMFSATNLLSDLRVNWA